MFNAEAAPKKCTSSDEADECCTLRSTITLQQMKTPYLKSPRWPYHHLAQSSLSFVFLTFIVALAIASEKNLQTQTKEKQHRFIVVTQHFHIYGTDAAIIVSDPAH